ncbi:enoyl-CoA hydratase/isomerase family protein [Vibrio hangzhouensis]|uniref:enoyl-CoA hydratase/isomerase family protein n=1 Tax=Vibrio hangzhouensis TaxID=462991 RepID=UPI001C965ADE|nr:enoyl-CoA hydratase/isomerase family protein [Vibrio hangzhouensis]MBY6196353.1 enoyl-CoA hydratase/isomerase family protein [Vibrio hangzhouensis]
MSDTVSFEELKCDNGDYIIAVATLDNPTSLNALTHNMLVLLNDQLAKWHEDDNVVCVLLDGAGEKAFCAGGDVRAMHDVMKHSPMEDAKAYCEAFFSVEYQCDYLIHTYCKPIIAWGEGIVMGGGMGLFMGASHKIVTPNSRLAMPEISIGLFPDVGATYFLNHLEQRLGLFLGMTGVMLNASDAMDIHLADHLVLNQEQPSLLKQLQHADWDSVEDSYEFVSECLTDLEQHVGDQKPQPQLADRLTDIYQACDADSVNDVVGNILALPGNESWLQMAKQNLSQGSAVTAHICFRQIHNYAHLSLADVFRLELILALRSVLLGEFQEGVRSRLVDKDGNPNWRFQSVEQVDTAVIDEMFTSLWRDDEHPLASLGHY